jgi:N-acetylmuramoyl-L-alanine amidase
MEFKRKYSIFILLSCIFLLPFSVDAQKVRRVVIDAGHGGHDGGAAGKYTNEKDITLAIALKTGKYIRENLKDVEVIFTRKTDVFVELYRRAKIANEAKADLFISIHCNANKSTSPYGSETYVMGLHKSEANLAVAQLENKAILLEDDYHVQYEGFNPTSPEGYIFFSMLQNAYLDQSLSLATLVQKNLKEKANIYNRGVKQAGFWVLYKTTMPSILIETAFVSNLNDEKVLSSEEGQDKLANAIFHAVKEYKQSVEKTGPPDYVELAEKEIPVAQQTEVNSGPANNTQPINSPPDAIPSGNTTPVNSSPVNNENTKTDNAALFFKVQFYICNTKLERNAAVFKGLEDVTWYKHQGMYKYTVGNEKTAEDAQKLISKVAAKGFKDSFVVAFLNGERISIDEAKKMQKN